MEYHEGRTCLFYMRDSINNGPGENPFINHPGMPAFKKAMFILADEYGARISDMDFGHGCFLDAYDALVRAGAKPEEIVSLFSLCFPEAYPIGCEEP